MYLQENGASEGMNLFTHYKQLENHYTNILMNLLSMNESHLLKLFVHRFLPHADELVLQDLQYVLFSEYAAAASKKFEYVLAIAPFPRKISEEEILPNPGSIPDAWVLGENVNILIEFKVTGTIDEAQFAAHRRKLSPDCRIIEITWNQIGLFMQEVEVDSSTRFLLDQFTAIIKDLKSTRTSSGMPRLRKSGRQAKSNEPYFIITGSAALGRYRIDVVLPNRHKLSISTSQASIMGARRWIEQFIKKSDNPDIYLTSDNEFIDKCVKPGRDKDEWNRWKFGSLGAMKK